MKVIEYLTAKYAPGRLAILSCEARAFGIPYPLRAGWVQRFGNIEITPEIEEKLRAALAGKLNKKRGHSAAKGLRVMAVAEPSTAIDDQYSEAAISRALMAL
jgi:hypothetical protein